MIVSTNLALRPFRNERLPWLFASALLAVALLATIVHVRFISELLSRNEAATVRTVLEDEGRIAELDSSLSAEPPVRIEADERVRLLAFKELVDRRVFPWRRVLAELESALSPDVRLTRITPSPGKEGQGILIDLSGEARTKDAAFSLAEGLDASPAFSRAALKSLSESDGLVEFDLEVAFEPKAAPASAPDLKEVR